MIIDRMALFCPAAGLTPANAIMSTVDPDVGGDKTFGRVRLSANGQEPPTHYGCWTAVVDQAHLNRIEGSFISAPVRDGYKASDGWTWETALADMGLQVITETI